MFFRLLPQHVFPDPALAEKEPNGLLAVGGDLHPSRVLLAYRMGIFPWYGEGQPIYWWSPDPRMVLFPADLRIRRSLAKRIRQRPYRLTMDAAFDEVVERCATIPRPGQESTWITEEMKAAYRQLHRLGHAHSVEAWEGDDLVGGLYGVVVGTAFCGESMFADRRDASKIAFVSAVQEWTRWGLTLVDCQVYTDHLASFGAAEVSRSRFLAELDLAQDGSLPEGRWSFGGG